MAAKHLQGLSLPLSAALLLSLPTAVFPASPSAMMQRWNAIAVDATGLDHTAAQPGENRISGEQLGPGRASRAMAIVHIAIFEAANAIAGKYQSYTGFPAAPQASMETAIAQAAHDSLNLLFPAQAAPCDKLLSEDMAQIPDGPAKTSGIDIGRRAVAAILALRANDGSAHAEPRYGIEFIPSDQPGKWRQDPISLHPLALGAHWGEVKPFVLDSADQFRTPPPPLLTSRRYLAAYEEVQRLGGDGIATRTERTADQTLAGIFWAYDGTPSLCAPPRLYNQIVMRIAGQMGTSADPVELARLLALVNVAMADAGIAIWESKYYYQFWRAGCGYSRSGVGRPEVFAAGRPRQQPQWTELHAAIPRLPLRTCRIWRRAVSNPAAILWYRRYLIHICIRRI